MAFTLEITNYVRSFVIDIWLCLQNGIGEKREKKYERSKLSRFVDFI